jgi:hypothetical protein
MGPLYQQLLEYAWNSFEQYAQFPDFPFPALKPGYW